MSTTAQDQFNESIRQAIAHDLRIPVGKVTERQVRRARQEIEKTIDADRASKLVEISVAKTEQLFDAMLSRGPVG